MGVWVTLRKTPWTSGRRTWIDYRFHLQNIENPSLRTGTSVTSFSLVPLGFSTRTSRTQRTVSVPESGLPESVSWYREFGSGVERVPIPEPEVVPDLPDRVSLEPVPALVSESGNRVSSREVL